MRTEEEGRWVGREEKRRNEYWDRREGRDWEKRGREQKKRRV